MKPLVASALAAGVILAFPSASSACTCGGTGSSLDAARAAIEESDVAFIGVLKSVRRIGDTPSPTASPIGSGFFRYRVIEAYGGDPGRFIRVRSDLSEIGCGLPEEEGREFALGADRSRRDGAFEAGLCSLVSPRALRRAAAEASVSRSQKRDC